MYVIMMKKKIILTALSSTTLFMSQAESALVTGLLNYWDFNGNANDSAGTASFVAAGTATGTTADNGMIQGTDASIGTTGSLFGDGFLSLGGGDGFVSVGGNSADLQAGGEDLTISLWFQVSAFTSDWQALISNGEQSEYRIARLGNTSSIAYAGGTGDISGGSLTTGDGEWHHVLATTENGGGTQLYLDGSLIASDAGPATIINDLSAELYIGANPESPNREWVGSIDDVATWDRVLTASEVSTIYNGGLAGLSLSQVPEPSSLTLLGLSGLFLSFRRRR